MPVLKPKIGGDQISAKGINALVWLLTGILMLSQAVRGEPIPVDVVSNANTREEREAERERKKAEREAKKRQQQTLFTAKAIKLSEPLVIDQNFTVLENVRLIRGPDFKGDCLLKVEPKGDKKLWGVTIHNVELVGGKSDVLGLYMNGVARCDIDVRIMDCNAGGAAIHGWNVRGRIHCMNNGMVNENDAWALRIHNDYANQRFDFEKNPKEWQREATNIVRLYGSHLERSPHLLHVEYGSNDVWYEGVLHGPTYAEREKHGFTWNKPLVEFDGVSGVCRLEGQLTWGNLEGGSVVIRDLGKRAVMPRPINLYAHHVVSDWDARKSPYTLQLDSDRSSVYAKAQLYQTKGDAQ